MPSVVHFAPKENSMFQEHLSDVVGKRVVKKRITTAKVADRAHTKTARSQACYTVFSSPLYTQMIIEHLHPQHYSKSMESKDLDWVVSPMFDHGSDLFCYEPPYFRQPAVNTKRMVHRKLRGE